MKKKLLCILTLVLAILVTFAACGDGNGSTLDGGDTTPDDGEDTTPDGGDTTPDDGGDTTPDEPEAPSHTHSYGEWVTTKEATKAEDGTRERVCSCGDKETEAIPATGSVGLAYKLNADGVSCTITDIGTCSDTEVVIPTAIDGKKVTSIGDGAFEYCSGLTSITIPDSVTSIGENAFAWCESLTSIIIPNSITSIGYQTFYVCKSLTSITIPNSVTSIGNFAFESCENLTSIHFGGTIAKWNAMEKGYYWDTGNYTVYCTDGNITK